MSMPWFRLYSRMIDDDRLRLLAFEDRWHFVALCCLKNDGLLDELDTDMRLRRIAVRLGVQLRELDEISRRLKEVGLIDETMSPVAWDKLQFRSDNSTERVKKYREKQQRNKVKRCGNVTVTGQDTDTDTEEDISPKGDCASGDALKPEHVVEEWNKFAPKLGKPLVRKITPARRQLLKARIGQNDLEDFVLVFTKAQQSKFLRGETGWRGFSFDWLFKQANFQKVIEGNYDG